MPVWHSFLSLPYTRWQWGHWVQSRHGTAWSWIFSHLMRARWQWGFVCRMTTSQLLRGRTWWAKAVVRGQQRVVCRMIRSPWLHMQAWFSEVRAVFVINCSAKCFWGRACRRWGRIVARFLLCNEMVSWTLPWCFFFNSLSPKHMNEGKGCAW